MKTLRPTLAASLLVATLTVAAADRGKPIKLTDGKTFAGWVGDTNKTWRIVDGAFVGGTLDAKVPRNEFLRSERAFTNFVLRVKFRLVGTEGFVNGGVQIRSQPALQPPNEMVGYQCDIGDGWWGAIYDETRRNKVLVKPDAGAVAKAVKKGEWNEYEIRAEGRRIRTSINGVAMVDYTEPDDSIPQHGLLGLQVHGGGKTEMSYKDITVEELP
ncbi:MAG: DUF1080 domain-containing protein [Verrucomicrobia bacterium]|nr:DUF1080 domain-containing protein [Verrucomicrobiota bacterium]